MILPLLVMTYDEFEFKPESKGFTSPLQINVTNQLQEVLGAKLNNKEKQRNRMITLGE